MGLQIVPFPNDFPNKGRFRTWDKDWNPTGFSDEPQHRGQVPLNYPEDATLFEIQAGGYIREATP